MSYWQYLETELWYKPTRANIRAWATAERDTKPSAYCDHETMRKYESRPSRAKPLSVRKRRKIRLELEGLLPIEDMP